MLYGIEHMFGIPPYSTSHTVDFKTIKVYLDKLKEIRREKYVKKLFFRKVNQLINKLYEKFIEINFYIH